MMTLIAVAITVAYIYRSAVTLGAVVVIQSVRLDIPKEDPRTKGQLLAALKDSILAIIMPLIILGGIYGGVFTPTEAGAVAVIYSLLVSAFIYRELDLQIIRTVIIKAGISTSVVFFVIATSQSMSWLITVSRVSAEIAAWIISASSNPFVLITLINLILLFLGVFLETQAIILLMAPLLLPITASIGMNPLMLGINSAASIMVLIVVWAIAVAGIVLTILFWGKFKILRVLLYIAMGWLIVFFWGDIIPFLPPGLLPYVLAGGITYTAGVVFYAGKRLPYHHAIWHLFCIGGSVAFFIGCFVKLR